ncbi:DUF4129 domain-containing protein [Halapricum hydrolyticum]|uniref:DUF4129 domain-containing protein n=1 Tax=Halapricum hydrolyticum TaxID=2979991 RepID=A0AAE3IDR0_9EURY|nr:DUF4129 domain-containing protein [Halapricum hydrolyticum]MCU4719102.1 DUF4129 domain-containing protein [Halapricum hydrolyticum]MCU4728126.1 DUF4129 domain-containing protein [Halapricum hydrolyticum]
MNRSQFIAVVVVVLSVAGLAIAAATVSTPSSSAPGTGLGDDPGDSGGGESQQSSSSATGSSGNEDLFVSLGVLLFSVAALVTLYIVVRGLTARRAAIGVLVIAVIALASLLTLSLLMDTVPAPGGDGPPAPNESDRDGAGEGGRTPTESPQQRTDVPPSVLGAFGLVMLVLVGAIYRYSGSDSDIGVEAEGDESEEPSSVQAVGEAAGRAADRLDADTDLENAIYRAWREMTDALDVRSPRTTTPEEFADVAVEAGMSREDVRELTRLFEEVRYGDAEPTLEREQRAQDALRRIQQAYAEEDPNE